MRQNLQRAGGGLALATCCVWALCFGLAPHAAWAAEKPEKIQIFGHLTQAFGRSSRGSILGTTEGGTSDLRNVAIQFRWERSERDNIVIQLSHERRGGDIFSPKEHEIELDWAFYERRLRPQTTLKVGRLNIPLGIYNEVRDVGTLLPFFSLPISFYTGVLSSAETVDGISIDHTFAARSEWSLDAELYAGGWDTFQQRVEPESKFGIGNLKARAENGVGLQLWLNTPVTGLRLGAGTLTWLLDGQLSPASTKDRWDSFHFSIDANGENWLFRAETRRWRFDQDLGAFLGLPTSLPAKAQRDGFYVQLGQWLTPRIGLFGQFEQTSLEDSLNLLPLDDLHEDVALSLNYRFRPDLLARIEFHSAATRLPLADPDIPIAVGGDPVDVDWAIVGLSVSF